MRNLAGKTAFITGGASGIGAAVVADTETGERSISIGGTFGVGVSGSRVSRN